MRPQDRIRNQMVPKHIADYRCLLGRWPVEALKFSLLIQTALTHGRR